MSDTAQIVMLSPCFLYSALIWSQFCRLLIPHLDHIFSFTDVYSYLPLSLPGFVAFFFQCLLMLSSGICIHSQMDSHSFLHSHPCSRLQLKILHQLTHGHTKVKHHGRRLKQEWSSFDNCPKIIFSLSGLAILPSASPFVIIAAVGYISSYYDCLVEL